MTDGNRLARWRECLPRARNAPISASSLSRALRWEKTRWTQLEKLLKWSSFQRTEVEQGVRGIASRLDVDPAAIDAHVAHVLDGGPRPVAAGAWREGQSPAIPMGRPHGTGRPLGRRVVAAPGDDDEPDPRAPQAARPILPEAVVDSLTDQILRMLASGETNVETARKAIRDLMNPLRDFYNKPAESATGAA